MNLNLYLERVRDRLKVTPIGALAEACGVSRRNIERIRSGDVDPTTGTLQRIVDGMKVVKPAKSQQPSDQPHPAQPAPPHVGKLDQRPPVHPATPGQQVSGNRARHGARTMDRIFLSSGNSATSSEHDQDRISGLSSNKYVRVPYALLPYAGASPLMRFFSSVPHRKQTTGSVVSKGQPAERTDLEVAKKVRLGQPWVEAIERGAVVERPCLK